MAGGPRALIILLAYGLCLGLSGRVVRFFVLPKNAPPPAPRPPGAPRFDTSVVIGKCENLIVLSFILAGEVTGIALIFAAKPLVRSDAIREDPSFYLGAWRSGSPRGSSASRASDSARATA